MNFISCCQATNLAEQVEKILQSSTGKLHNKYLYLGSHGARAWMNIEKETGNQVFGIKEVARTVLSDNIEEILNVIIEDHSIAGLDVVSLGTGVGIDDKIILQKLIKKSCLMYKKKLSYYLVDLSIDLLQNAAVLIEQYIIANQYDNFKFEKNDFIEGVHAICIDIENLSELSEYFKQHKKNNVKLYHLLGLTLGNNYELEFLETISECMSDEDFLLLSVDFCLDNDEKYKEFSLNSYNSIKEIVHDFLSGPLKTAIKASYSTDDKMHFIKLRGVWRHDLDYIHNVIPIREEEKSNADKYNLSRVEGALSLARYYVIKDEENKEKGEILCDFSNKYESSCFKKWLDTYFDTHKLKLVHDSNIKQWGEKGQHLILLRKTRPDERNKKNIYDARLELKQTYKTLENIHKIFNGVDNDIASHTKTLKDRFKETNEDNINYIIGKSSEGKILPNALEGKITRPNANEYLTNIDRYIKDDTPK